MMIYEEIEDFLPSESAAPQAPLSKEKYRALFAAATEETKAGVLIHVEKIISMSAQKRA